MSDLAVAEFIDALRVERLKRRIPQRTLAKQIGAHGTQLCAWEGLENIPSDETLHRWAAALEVEVPEGVQGWVFTPAECGTESGYSKHRRAKEPTCDACKRAHADMMTAWRKRRRPQ